MQRNVKNNMDEDADWEPWISYALPLCTPQAFLVVEKVQTSHGRAFHYQKLLSLEVNI